VEDAEIVLLYWQRNECAIDETQRKYGAYLTRIAYNILGDLQDSKECVNDTYLKAWSAMPPHRPIALSTFLGKITRRTAIDVFRKRNSQKHGKGEFCLTLSELAQCLSGGDDPEDELGGHLLGEAINAFLRALPTETRRIFVARYYFATPIRALAARCGVSQSKVKSLLHRTRLLLKEHLIKEGFLP